MNTHVPHRSSSVGRNLLRAGIAVVATLVFSALFVALLVFAPSAFATYGGAQPGGLSRYVSDIWAYFTGLFQGQLTPLRSNAQAWRLLQESTRHTLELLAISMAAAIPLGILWGGLMATSRWRRLRLFLLALNTLLLSLPAVAILLLAVETVANMTYRTGIQLTYVQGYGLDRHLILPAGTLALRGAATMARALQIAQDDIMHQEWIRAARARGLGGLQLWWRQVLPALRLPAIGIFLSMLRQMVSAIIIVEYIYSWNGLGQRMLDYEFGLTNRPENAVALTSALILVLLFVLVDTAGRAALRFADPRLNDQE